MRFAFIHSHHELTERRANNTRCMRMFFKNACIKSLFKTIRQLLKSSSEIKRTIRLEFQWYITFVKNKTDLIQNWRQWFVALSLRASVPVSHMRRKAKKIFTQRPKQNNVPLKRRPAPETIGKRKCVCVSVCGCPRTETPRRLALNSAFWKALDATMT